jgi:hypothetical protein
MPSARPRIWTHVDRPRTADTPMATTTPLISRMMPI